MTEDIAVAEFERFPELKSITKCDECPIMWVCDKQKKNGRCHFELMRLKATTQKGGYLTSSDQKKFLAELEENLRKYEEVIRYDAKPMKKDLIKLIHLKLQLYEVIYAKAPQVNTNLQINSNATSVDIKKMMENLQEEEAKIVDTEEVKEDELSKE